MPLKFRIAPLALAMVFSGAAATEGFSSRKGGQVNPVSQQVFEVIPEHPSAGGHFWCVAGDYARRVLRAPWSTPVYIYRGRGPSETTNRRSAVQFTLDAALAGDPRQDSYRSRNSLERGDNMSVQRAANYCNELHLGF